MVFLCVGVGVLVCWFVDVWFWGPGAAAPQHQPRKTPPSTLYDKHTESDLNGAPEVSAFAAAVAGGAAVFNLTLARRRRYEGLRLGNPS